MSENRIVNSRLLEDLEVNSFLGKLLTTTDAEITECFTKDFPPPTEAQLAAGPVGTLSKLERAAMAQASKLTSTITKMSQDFIELADTEAFKQLELRERIKQKEVVTNKIQALAVEVHEYVEFSQELTTARLPHVDTNVRGYFLCNDGNFYSVPGAQAAADTVTPSEPSATE